MIITVPDNGTVCILLIGTAYEAEVTIRGAYFNTLPCSLEYKRMNYFL